MRTLRCVLCDVFTSRPLEGNQLAVFTDARGVPDGLMQRLALEMGFSESTFVLPPSGTGHARVRIFTPRVELAFAGHPVLGTALVIGGAMEAREVRLELTESIVPVQIEREGARATFGWVQQPLPKALPFDAESEALAALGVEETALPVGCFTNGPEHLLVAIDGRQRVADLQPDLSRLGRVFAGTVSVFARDSEGVKTRVFAPGAGVAEDPATGSAAGALGAYLAEHERLAFGETLRIEQGAEIGRPSELFVRVRGARSGGAVELEQVEVGGGVQIVARGEFRLPF